MPISIIDVPLPEQPDDLWHAYCELIRTNNHLLIDGPGWDATDEASLHRARANLAERTTERLLAVDRERPVGFASLSVQLVDDPDAPQVFVFVLPDERGRGIGGELAARLDERLAARGAKRATAWVEAPRPGDDRVVPTSGVGAAPADHDGVRFALSRGYELHQIERVSRYDFAAPLIDPVAARDTAAAVAGEEYEALTWEGATPEEFLADIAVLKERMSVDPPSGGLTVVETTWDAERVRRMEDSMLPTMRRWVAAIRHRPSGRTVAISELMLERDAPGAFVDQWDTIVHPDHRGHRLGMMVKAANLVQVREAAPDATAIVTWNAEENRHMLDVNEALGFRPILVEAAFEKTL